MEQKQKRTGSAKHEGAQKQDDCTAALLAAMGDSRTDVISLVASRDVKAAQARMDAVMAMEVDSQASKDYWAKYEKGLNKEVHGEKLDLWSSFVPLSAKWQPERKFPLIFCLHGSNNSIHTSEGYGVMQLAAREECIVISPENENVENLLALLDYAKAHFPVDEGRVYAMGFSFGGCMASRAGMTRPDAFAGIAMCGMLFAGDMRSDQVNGRDYPPYHLTEEMTRRVEEAEIPFFIQMGENEMLELLPFWREPQGRAKKGAIPLSRTDKQRMFNVFRKIAGCPPAVFLNERDKADPVEESIGVRFERTEVRTCMGRKYFIGDSVRSDGECILRTVACENMVHLPSVAYAELAWEYLSHYVRDPKTKKLLRLLSDSQS